jgi:hypothetical protein
LAPAIKHANLGTYLKDVLCANQMINFKPTPHVHQLTVDKIAATKTVSAKETLNITSLAVIAKLAGLPALVASFCEY